MVYGNECLFLNPLHAQCLICGSLVLLDHFNDVMQKSDKLDVTSWYVVIISSKSTLIMMGKSTSLMPTQIALLIL